MQIQILRMYFLRALCGQIAGLSLVRFCAYWETEIVRTCTDFDASLAISGYIQQNRCIGILIDVLRK